MKKGFGFLSLLVLLAIVTACGSGKSAEPAAVEPVDEAVAASTKNEAIEITDAAGQTITFDEAPSSFAALSSGDMDMLLALDANVVGRPSLQGPVDENIKGIEEIGNPHQPNFEQIAEVHPDVLVASPSMKQHAENLERQGTTLIYTAANSVNDIQNTIEMFGKMLGNEEKASELNDSISRQLEEGKASVEGEGKRTLLVYGAPGTYLAALPNSLSGDLLELAGGVNIASDFPNEEKYPQYASLSVEKIIERNPEVVMLITHGEPEAVKAAFEEEMTKNPAWKNLEAVKEGHVIVLPSHLFGTNPGTKVVDAFDVMKESLNQK